MRRYFFNLVLTVYNILTNCYRAKCKKSRKNIINRVNTLILMLKWLKVLHAYSLSPINLRLLESRKVAKKRKYSHYKRKDHIKQETKLINSRRYYKEKKPLKKHREWKYTSSKCISTTLNRCSNSFLKGINSHRMKNKP